MEKSILQYSTKLDLVYQILKEEIIHGELPPNTQLLISQVANRFQVSVTPVREAIKRLESEGLVEVTAHSKAKVSLPSIKELKEMLEVRLSLELLSISLSYKNIGEDELYDLKELINKMYQAYQQEDEEEYGVLDKKFHMYLHERSQNSYLFRLILDLYAKTERTRGVFKINPQRMNKSIQQHNQMVKCLEEGDEEKLIEIAEKHRKEANKMLLDFYEEYIENNSFTQ